jgi:hypothetical protein
VSDLVNWTSLDNGKPFAQRRHPYEVDAAGDPHPMVGPNGDIWLLNTAAAQVAVNNDVLIRPMYRSPTVTSNGNANYVGRDSGILTEHPYNGPTFLGTGVTTYTANCFDDIRYNNGVNNLTLTMPRASTDCRVRVSTYNSTTHSITLSFNGSDFGPSGCKNVYGSQSMVLLAVNQNWWTCTTGPIGTAPTISSGFGSTPSVTQNSGPSSFSVNVGTGGSATSGVVGLPPASHAWACSVADTGATPTGQTEQTTPAATNAATFTNYSRITGLAVAWTASEIIQASCFPN